ncbi:uroporphyrin-III C-methyltransferase [Gammaproteobacteria bacterium]
MTEQNTNPNRHKKVLVSLIILIILIIAVALGKYFGFSFSKAALTTPATTIAELQSKLTQGQAVIQDLQNQNEVQKQDYAKATSWKPIAIEHLVRMADLTLNTTRDVKTALVFLLAAKKYTNETKELVISHALNKDIASLQAVAIVNPEELVLKIDMVSRQVDTLPVTPSQAVIGSITPMATESQPARLLNRLFVSVVKALKDIVIIRHQTTEPILPPQQATILRLNIQAKLLQAELAVMQRQNKLYQVCLTQVVDLITKYFACNDAATIDVLHVLQELQQTNLQPDLPALTESMMAIQNTTTQES